MFGDSLFDRLARLVKRDEAPAPPVPELGPFNEAELDAAFDRLLADRKRRFLNAFRKRLARRLRKEAGE